MNSSNKETTTSTSAPKSEKDGKVLSTSALLSKLQLDVRGELSKQEGVGNAKEAAAMLTLLERVVELEAKWVKSRNQSSLAENRDWQELKKKLILTLERFPDAYQAVLEAIGE